MTNRTTKVASAILLGAFSGGLLAVGATPLHAADTCLSGPKGAAPTGSHWHYRIDHAAKRNCWYVRAEGGKIKSANVPGMRALPQAKGPLQRSVADARAEAAPADIWQSNGVAAETPRSRAPANIQDLNPPETDDGQSAAASRGLDQTNPTVTTPAPQSDDSAAALKPPALPTPAVPSAASDKRSFGRVPILLAVILGALATAAIFGSTIFKFGSVGRNDRRDFGGDKRAPWDSIDIGPTIQSPPLATKTPMTTTSIPREAREPAIPDEIVQLLAKLSKEAAA